MGCGGTKEAVDTGEVELRTDAPEPAPAAPAPAEDGLTKDAPVEVGPAEDGPVVRLIKVDDLLNNAILVDERLGLTSEDVLQQHWTAKKSIAGLFGPHSFKLVPWRRLRSTKYGVLTYSWGNREKRIWGATWADMIRALKKKRKLKEQKEQKEQKALKVKERKKKVVLKINQKNKPFILKNLKPPRAAFFC